MTGQSISAKGTVRPGFFTSSATCTTELAPDKDDVSTPTAAAKELRVAPGLMIWPNVTLAASILGMPRTIYKKIAISSSATMIFPALIAVLLPNHATTVNTTRRPTAARVELISALGNSGWTYMANKTPNNETIVGISSVLKEINGANSGWISFTSHISCAPETGSAAAVYAMDSARSTTTNAAPTSAHTTPAPYSFATVGNEPKMPDPTIHPMPINRAPISPIFFFSISKYLKYTIFTRSASSLCLALQNKFSDV